jgi:GT2 family glycosyltransferase
VIVPTVNGADRLRDLLATLDRQTVEHEVIVVDNGSPGAIASKACEGHDNARAIRLEENAGFSRAMNLGAAQAQGEAIVMVNDDCTCDPQFVERMVAALDPARGVIMSAGVMRDHGDPSIIEAAGMELDSTLFCTDYLYGEPLSRLDEGVEDPIGPCGAAAAFDKDAFLAEGGFDEGLFAYWEDVDLVLRLRRAGGSCVLARDARGTHGHSSTLGPGSARKNYLAGFGRAYVLRKWGVLGWRRLPGVLARELGVCMGQAVIDRNLAGVRGRINGFRAAPRAEPYPADLLPDGGGTDTLAALRRRAARRSRLGRRGGGATAGLDARLDGPLPDRIAVGGGTALFLKGRCATRDGRRVTRLGIAVNGEEVPTMAHGMSARRTARDGDMWWGIVPLEPLAAPGTARLALHAELEGGGDARAELGTVALRPALDLDPVPGPPGAGDADRPLIAICMATFEPPLELFARQIDSIRAQTHDNWICVISDDHSRPERLARMREILGDDERFVLSPSTERLGFYRNFERALALAPVDAELLGLADQDDHWHPDKLEVLARDLESGATLAYSDTRVIDEDGRVRSDTYWRYRRNNYTDFTSLLITNAITGAAALFRRELAERALPFPPPHGDIFHDHWIALVAMATGDIRYVDRPLYDYVQHSEAAIGFTNANAGRGRWGGRLADVLLRIMRLGYRLIRPVGQIRYFDNYCRLALQARTLEVRFGDTLSSRDRRAISRIQSCDRSLAGAAWLGYRALRPLTGRNETMGMERGLLAGIVWRRIASLRARIGRTRRAR